MTIEVRTMAARLKNAKLETKGRKTTIKVTPPKKRSASAAIAARSKKRIVSRKVARAAK